MSPASSTGSDPGPLPTMPSEIEELRALLDARLAALEAALADPDQYDSLEGLLFDLARVATKEADAAVQQAYDNAQREAKNAIAAVRAEGRAALEAERVATTSLRQEVEQAQAKLKVERAAAAELRDGVKHAHAALQAEQTATAALRRDLEAARLAGDQEQTTRATLRREEDARASAALSRDLEAARLAVEQEQTTSTTLRHELEEARTASAALGRDLAAARLALDQEQSTSTTLRRELEEARTASAVLGRDLDAARMAVDQEQKSNTTLHRELEEARNVSETERAAAAQLRDAIARLEQELAGARNDAQTHSNTLSRVQTDLDSTVRDAEALTEAANRERQELAGKLEGARQAAAEAEADARARYEQLREATEQQVRALELAVQAAETRAEAAGDELELPRRDVKPQKPGSARSPAPTAGTASPSPDPAAKTAAGPATPPQPLRRASRYVMTGEIEVQVDGSSAWLIDLSTSGAQLLSLNTLKPNRMVTVALPLGDSLVSCRGKIVWARIDPAPASGQLRYRAGVSFTKADMAAVEAFLRQHGGT